MSITKIMSLVFGILFVVFLYGIIYYALKIMYKDVKSGEKGKKKKKSSRRFGVEVVNSGANDDLETGSVLIIGGTVTIGRKEGNTIVLSEPFVSGRHARFFIKNNNLYIEDLKSTNGVYVNNKRIEGAVKLSPNDTIKIGSLIFKLLKETK